MKAHQPKPRRIRWHVLPLPAIVGWAVIRDDREMCRFFFKFRAVSFAVHECEYELEIHDRRSELLIHGRNGRFQDARTYGADPRHIKG